MQKDKKVVFIVGPTATGKTALAVKLAKKINADIISCDSMQIYKGMQILSQAPSRSDQKAVKHHLVSQLGPRYEYNVSKFKQRAVPIIKSCHKKGKIPLIVGGSGLYVKTLLDGIFEFNKRDLKYRKYLERLARRKGAKFLYDRLKKADPQTAAVLHQNDLRRIIRALEVYRLSGKPISYLKKTAKGIWGRYDIRLLGLSLDRDKLYERINKRVDEMFKEGIIKEVEAFSKKKMSLTAGQALGYKEVLGYLKDEYPLAWAVELLKKNTRHFAKRQIAWFRPDPRIKWFDAGDKDIMQKMLKEIRKAAR